MAIIFPEMIERENTITVDGYSNKKTLNAAIKDFGKYIENKFHNGEGQSLIDMVNDGINETNSPFIPASKSEGGYFFEVENVGCASRCDNDTDEIEYKEANFYFVIRLVK